MWWEDDSEVGGRVGSLLSAWREGVLPGVVGVGSTWDRYGERVPFVAIDARLDPRPWLWAPQPQSRFTRRLIRRFGPLTPPWEAVAAEDREPTWEGVRVEPRPQDLGRVNTFRRVALALGARRLQRRREGSLDDEHLATRIDRLIGQADEQLESEHPTVAPLLALQRFGAPPQTRVGYLGSLALVSSPARRLRSPAGKKATLGCVVEVNSTPILTTAGHIDAQLGETLFTSAPRWKETSGGEPLGEVVAITSSASQDFSTPTADGIDVCAAKSTQLDRGTLEQVRVEDARSLHFGDLLQWNGGATGSKEGWTGDLVGHFVATAGYHKRSVGQAAVIQDAQSAIEYLETRVGPIERVMRVVR